MSRRPTLWASRLRRQLLEQGGTAQPVCRCGATVPKELWEAHRARCPEAREEEDAAPAAD